MTVTVKQVLDKIASERDGKGWHVDYSGAIRDSGDNCPISSALILKNNVHALEWEISNWKSEIFTDAADGFVYQHKQRALRAAILRACGLTEALTDATTPEAKQ